MREKSRVVSIQHHAVHDVCNTHTISACKSPFTVLSNAAYVIYILYDTEITTKDFCV